MSVYQQLSLFLKQSLFHKRNAQRQTDDKGKPLWRKTRRSTLFWLLCAMVRERTCCLVSLARALPEPTQVRDRNKRLWRFLDNEALQIPQLCQVWGQEVVARFDDVELLPILLDPTWARDQYLVFKAAVPYKRRALPIQMTAYRVRQGRSGRTSDGKQGPKGQSVSLPEPQPDLEEQFVKDFIAWLPRKVKTCVLLADRAFGRADFFALLKRHHCPFVIRTRGYIWMRHDAYAGLIQDYPLRPGQTVFLEGVQFRKQKSVKVNLLLVWERGQTEPWFLATPLTDPKLVKRLYRQRMRVEQGIRDSKGHLKLSALWRWQNLEHVRRMLLMVMLVFLFLAWLYERTIPVGYGKRQRVRGRLSWISVVIAFVKEQLTYAIPVYT